MMESADISKQLYETNELKKEKNTILLQNDITCTVVNCNIILRVLNEHTIKKSKWLIVLCYNQEII